MTDNAFTAQQHVCRAQLSQTYRFRRCLPLHQAGQKTAGKSVARTACIAYSPDFRRRKTAPCSPVKQIAALGSLGHNGSFKLFFAQSSELVFIAENNIDFRQQRLKRR